VLRPSVPTLQDTSYAQNLQTAPVNHTYMKSGDMPWSRNGH